MMCRYLNVQFQGQRVNMWRHYRYWHLNVEAVPTGKSLSPWRRPLPAMLKDAQLKKNFAVFYATHGLISGSTWTPHLIPNLSHIYREHIIVFDTLTLILRRSRTGTVWFYTSTSNKRSARPKLYTKSLTRDLKRMYIRLTLVRISINL